MSETYTPDNLLAGSAVDIVTKVETLAASVGALARGCVLGKITKGAVTKALAGAGSVGANTGDGTLTLDVTTPLLAGAKPGIYKVRIVRATVAAVGATSSVVPGEGELVDPNGRVIATFELVGSSGVTVSRDVMFALVEGSTPFAVTDGWTITVAAGSGQLKPVDSSAIHGEEAPYAVLLEAMANLGSTQSVIVALRGYFSEGALTFGGIDTIATHRDALKALGIYTKATLAA